MSESESASQQPEAEEQAGERHHQRLLSIIPKQRPLRPDPSGRYFINEAQHDSTRLAARMIPLAAPHLLASLTNLLATAPPSLPWSGAFAKGLYCGLFVGPTSIAYLFLWLSKTHPDLLIDGKSPADYCAAYLALDQDKYGPEETNRSGCSLNHEFMCYNAVKACHTQDLRYVRAFVDNIDKLTMRPAFIEVLFGRAGLLSLMRTVKYFVPAAGEILDPHVDAVIEHCLSYDPWTFGVRPDHQKRYIGAAHGDIGIIASIVLSNASYAPRVQPRLERILALQLEDGNWPACDDDDSEKKGEELVQFCHGAPGMIWCLVAIQPFFPDLRDRIEAAVDKARGVVWEKGMLTKEPCLCHGITGNALTLTEPQRSHFLFYATAGIVKNGLADGAFEKSSDESGLWWSEAGRAWGWMMMDYEQSGRGNSLRDIGFPGVTNP
ncbi:hypothetical protein Dda_6064 [Drechslerella dactyloides]|uniref:Uncharacterized protein n=1 Tax=Drechslerella dactyloides TaxID=74499 RepID=A0AAD6NGW8_DREDA|nr:hypothetical protein Dda_6064 [Drechslerella dactyloides]